MTNDKLQDLRGSMGLATDKLQEQEAQKALNNLALQQALQNLITGYAEEQPGFKKGKDSQSIPKASALSNIIPNGLGALGGLYQYMDAAGQDIVSPDVYASNPYARAALRNMANIHVDKYGTMRQMYDAERRANYAINRTGGLTGGLKYAAKVAQAIGTQLNIGKLLNDLQLQENQYRTAYNQALLLTGENAATRRMSANQIREDMTAKAHAQKQQMKSMGMRNIMDYINNYAANEYRRVNGNAMLDLYQQSINLDRDSLEKQYEAFMSNYGNKAKPAATAATPVVTSTTPAFTYMAPWSNTIAPNWVTLGGDIKLAGPSLQMPYSMYRRAQITPWR